MREDLTKTLLDHVVENHERPGYSEPAELNNSNQSESINIDDHSDVKNGVKLSKPNDQWATAKSFFKAELPTHEIGKDNLDSITQKLSDTIYGYFHPEFGSVVKTSATEFKDKYKDFSKHQLRKALKTLKSSNLENNLREITFVSKLLRRKISSTSTDKILTTMKLITTNRLTQDSGVIVRNISTKRRLCYHSLKYLHATCIIKNCVQTSQSTSID